MVRKTTLTGLIDRECLRKPNQREPCFSALNNQAGIADESTVGYDGGTVR